MRNKIPYSDSLKFSIASESDMDWLASLYQDPDVMQFISGGAKTQEEAYKKARSVLELSRENGHGYYLFSKKNSDEKVGYVVLRPFEWSSDFTGTEIGYMLDKKFWGQGLATKAVEALFEFAIENWDCEKLLALINKNNAASIKIIQNLGFEEISITLEKFPKDVVWVYI